MSKEQTSYRSWRAQPLSDRIFDVINHILMALIGLITAYPLYYVIIMSFSKKVVGTYFWPNGVTLNGYKEIFQYGEFWNGYWNTILYTVAGTIVSLVVTMTFAYAISRKYFVGRQWFLLMVMIPMFISGGMIPGYLTVTQLGLVDTRFYIIISAAASTYNIIVARTFFNTTIPNELYEASTLDGCGDGRFFTQIVLPLSKPIIAVEALYYGVGRWNSFTTEMIYLRSQSKYPLALVLRQLLWSIESIKATLSGGNVDMSNISDEMRKYLEQRADTASIMQYCMIIVSCVPMMIIYPALQKYFAKGVMIGAVKG